MISGWGWTMYGVRLYQNVTEDTNATTRAFERNWIFTAIVNFLEYVAYQSQKSYTSGDTLLYVQNIISSINWDHKM